MPFIRMNDFVRGAYQFSLPGNRLFRYIPPIPGKSCLRQCVFVCVGGWGWGDERGVCVSRCACTNALYVKIMCVRVYIVKIMCVRVCARARVIGGGGGGGGAGGGGGGGGEWERQTAEVDGDNLCIHIQCR